MASFAVNHRAEPNPQVNLLSTGASSQAADAAGDTSTSTISSNDFLTLLVTELKNQDPTSNSDPNQYVNQLVQVNSLEQLIQINQTLTNDAGSGSAASQTAGAAAGAVRTHTAPQNGITFPTHPASSTPAAGNLSIPPGSAAARRVAQALGSSTSGNL